MGRGYSSVRLMEEHALSLSSLSDSRSKTVRLKSALYILLGVFVDGRVKWFSRRILETKIRSCNKVITN